MSLIKVLSFFLVSLSLITIIDCVDFSDCPTEAKFGKLVKINVSNCTENDERCPFQTNKNVSMELSFKPTQNFEDAKIRIAGILNSIPVPFKINPDTACSYGAKCPLKNDEESVIILSFPIKQTYPRIKLIVQLSLTAPTGESIICLRFPAVIV